MINKQEPEVGKDIHGESLGLRTINACITRHDDFIGDGTNLDITLNAATRLVSITVLDYPVALRASAGASMSNFDLYLLPGQHELLVGVDVTVFSMYADGGGATVETIERSSL